MLVIPTNPLNNQDLTQEQHCRLAKVLSVEEVDKDLHLVVVRFQVEQWQEAEVDLQVVECLTLSMARCLEIFLDKQMQALVQEWDLRHME